MKKIKKLLVSTMALMMTFGAVACGGGGGGVPSLPNSSGQGSSSSVSTPDDGGDDNSDYVPVKPFTLNVYSFSGGYGTDWMESLITRYKKERAGDEIWVNGIKYDGIHINKTYAKHILESMIGTGEQYDVWFQEQVYYNQYVARGDLFHDMTDVLTSENPYEPGKTLESKMSEEQKAYYERNGKYYGVPHYAGYVGIVYNKQMFDSNWCYLKKDYDKDKLETEPAWCFVSNLDEPRTPGPDGIEFTDDDGLPTTYAEFYALCEYIAGSNKPITWSGKHRHGYLNWFLMALSANNEGLQQISLNYTYDGTATNLVAVTEDAEGNVTETPLEDLAITPANGSELAKQRGKYYAFDFLETIVDNNWYTETSFSQTNEQTDAQRDFVMGVDNTSERASMLIEGCWWEMESKESFDSLKQGGGVTNPKDNFRWMPLPCIDEEAAAARAASIQAGGKGYTLTDTHNSLCFIGKQVSDDVYAIAKDFIQFAYTDESLADFSIITDTTKAVQYKMTNSQKAKMSAYGRSLMDMQEKADIVCTFAENDFYQKNETRFVDYKTLYDAVYDGKTVQVCVDEFKKGVSATKYFNGMIANQKDLWDRYIIF